MSDRRSSDGLNLVLRTRPRFRRSSIPEAASQTQTTHPGDIYIGCTSDAHLMHISTLNSSELPCRSNHCMEHGSLEPFPCQTTMPTNILTISAAHVAICLALERLHGPVASVLHGVTLPSEGSKTYRPFLRPTVWSTKNCRGVDRSMDRHSLKWLIRTTQRFHKG